MTALENCKTLTGLSLGEAFAELNRQLPPGAYKAIQGGKGGKLGLTDIIPAFLNELLLELFGPMGFGWWYEIADMHTGEPKLVERSKGYTEEESRSRCTIRVFYAYLDGAEFKISHPIVGTGGSTNTQEEWAEKGAVTSALQTAWSIAGYQLEVYKGYRSHENVTGAGQGSTSGSQAQAPSRQSAPSGGNGDSKAKKPYQHDPSKDGLPITDNQFKFMYSKFWEWFKGTSIPGAQWQTTADQYVLEITGKDPQHLNRGDLSKMIDAAGAKDNFLKAVTNY